uniref:hypothetical protein n=1 Tax=Novipirellula sp. TaxID=2795430 RepID=UPI00356A11A4
EMNSTGSILRRFKLQIDCIEVGGDFDLVLPRHPSLSCGVRCRARRSFGANGYSENALIIDLAKTRTFTAWIVTSLETSQQDELLLAGLGVSLDR